MFMKNTDFKKHIQTLGWILLFSAILIAAAFIFIKIRHWGPKLDAPEQGDFGVYYYAAKISKIAPKVLYHHHQWKKVLGNEFNSRLPFLYIPAYAILLQPLSNLPYDTARRVWFWLSIVAILIIPFIVRQQTSSKRVFALSLCLWALNSALLDTLFHGQVNAFLAVFLTLACAGLSTPEYRKQFLAGMCLGFATAVKPFPIGLTLYAFFHKKYIYVAGAATSMILLFVISFIALPFSVTQDYTRVILGISTDFAPPNLPIFWNQSIAAFWSKLSMPIDSIISTSPLTNPIWVKVFIWVSSLVIAGITTQTLLLKINRDCHKKQNLKIGAILITMLLLAPCTWWHYLLITTYIFIAVAEILVDDSKKWWQSITLPLGYLLIIAQRGMERIIPIVRITMLSSLTFFGLLLWWFTIISTLRKKKRQAN